MPRNYRTKKAQAELAMRFKQSLVGDSPVDLSDFGELTSAVLRAFGGAEGYANHLWGEYQVQKPGSQVRLQTLRLISRMAEENTKQNKDQRTFEMSMKLMDEGQLNHLLHEVAGSLLGEDLDEPILIEEKKPRRGAIKPRPENLKRGTRPPPLGEVP